jgi:hypothetical protein
MFEGEDSGGYSLSVLTWFDQERGYKVKFSKSIVGMDFGMSKKINSVQSFTQNCHNNFQP